jgi:hypothetical protein
MEKVMLAVRGPIPTPEWCSELRKQAEQGIVGMGFPGVAVNVRDDLVTASKMTLTTFDPPVIAIVTVWTEQSYGPEIAELVALLEDGFGAVAGYLVTESVPLPVPRVDIGQRTAGLSNMAFLRRPPELEESIWRRRWHLDHTGVAIATQATFGYVQNAVVRAITPDAPAIAAIVEEFFPIEAVGDIHAFFGATDDDDLTDRMTRMVASTHAFGADQNIDTVPTSQYVYRDPFVR